MKIYFTIYSSEFQKHNFDNQYYKNEVENNSIIEIDDYNTELIISKISDESLKIIIDAHIKGLEPENYEEELFPLNGGLRIEYQNQTIEHQCCSELNDYKNWKKILDASNDDWKELWIGHPSIYYRIKAMNIEFSEYYDAIPKEIQIKFAINKEIFNQELRKELNEIDKFKMRLYHLIDNERYNKKEILKKILIE